MSEIELRLFRICLGGTLVWLLLPDHQQNPETFVWAVAAVGALWGSFERVWKSRWK